MIIAGFLSAVGWFVVVAIALLILLGVALGRRH